MPPAPELALPRAERKFILAPAYAVGLFSLALPRAERAGEG